MGEGGYLDAYLQQLPHGLDSYVGCEQKGSLIQQFLITHPELVKEAPRAPEPLRQIIVRPPAMNAWIPEVLANAVFAWARDAFFPSDATFAQAIQRMNERLFATAAYRLLMMVVSPQRMVTLAAARWSAFHRGSEMKALLRSKHRASVSICFPPFLFGAIHGWQYVGAIRAVLIATGAYGARVKVVSVASTQLDFDIVIEGAAVEA